MRRFVTGLLASVSTLILTAGIALADPSSPAGSGSGLDPGVNIGTWISTNVAALFAPIVAAIALYYLVKRQMTQFLGFAAFAVIVALFVFAGGAFKDAAVGLAKWVIGR
ncbi:MAG: hypothetical protein JWN15_2027 [Firmicutes bacterium]|nr:hypothetical protein [Bacillota bacterium]